MLLFQISLLICLKLSIWKISARHIESLFPLLKMEQFLIKACLRLYITRKNICAASNPTDTRCLASVLPKDISGFSDTTYLNPQHTMSLPSLAIK